MNSKKREIEPGSAKGNPAVRFVSVFIILLIIYFSFTQSGWFIDGFFPPFQHLNVELIAGLLQWIGEPVTYAKENIFAPTFTLAFVRGCDALDPTATFICAIIAYPTSIVHKLWGIATGISAIFVLNIGRVISLYYIQLHIPDWYHVMHLHVWQVTFVIIAIALWAMWASALPGRSEQMPHAA